MHIVNITWIFVIYIFIFRSESLYAQPDTIKYFFGGHTYQWHTAGDKVDERLEKMDFFGIRRHLVGG
ncbi:hypothetical protein SAMN05444274_10862 [Mariniphaga anaerophila]|uniref:Uncharacterized protein n=1 Tax=Mariniphaga anaerophila TaxID=1484053 RepID=A0A1M5E363_9BACT|nr:hypothetical protein SAMN05444274_10862 [Mariniphaga anaerophila]